MQNEGWASKRIVVLLMRLLPILSLVVPITMLYFIGPDYFEKLWQGRTFELFFLWLCFMELILNWEELKNEKIVRAKSLRSAVYIVSLLLPTIYVVAANYFGLNTAIFRLATSFNIEEHWALLIPLSTEYFVFAVFFASIVLLAYGFRGLKNYSLPIVFAGAIGVLYTIDNVYHWGTFTPFQILVTPTTWLASKVLGLMGYNTQMAIASSSEYGTYPTLFVQNAKGWAGFGIAWPCAGIESLVIYSVVILLFLSRSGIPLWQRISYFVGGGIATYFINVLRIATLFMIQINTGGGYALTAQAQQFHDYYGMLYSITWIVSYPLIIIGSRTLWGMLRKPAVSLKDSSTRLVGVDLPR